jgi:TolB-like protein
LAFFAELKRRRVFRVALVYAGVAWATAQVADVLEPVLNLPEWTVSMVLFLLILGFPIAMVLAWAFDIGPSGIETTPSMSRIGPVRVAIYMALLLVATAGIVFLVSPGLILGDRSEDNQATRQDQDQAGADTLYNSVAVLPFENLSDDPNNDHIGSGIAEEMRNSLARVPGLRIAARTSSVAMRDNTDDIRTIGERLGVSTIIQGAVRRAGDDLRITVQLIDTESGFQLWSNAYDRQVTDLIAVQREISAHILTELQGEMPAIMLERITSSLTDDLEAYDYYLRGRALWRQRSFADGTLPVLKEAIALYRKAIVEDPNFAEAYGALAEALMAISQVTGKDYAGVVAEAEIAARRAVELNPNLGRTYHALGMIRITRHDWVGAQKMLRTGIELSPGNVDLRLALGAMLQTVGRLQDARTELDLAARFDPVSRLVNELQGTLDLDLGLYESARDRLTHLEGKGMGEYALATAYWRIGNEAAAEQSFRAIAAAVGRPELATDFLAARRDPAMLPAIIKRLRRNDPVPIDFVLLLELGAWDSALEVADSLIKAGRFVWLWSVWDDKFREFRSQPGFAAFAGNVGFIDYWRADSMADKCRWEEQGFECS